MTSGASTTYRRMWENNGHRPYWARVHVCLGGKSFEQITGFCYREPVFVIGPQATNAAYWPVGEMDAATEYFRRWWTNQANVDRYFSMLQAYFSWAESLRRKFFSLEWSRLSTDQILSLLSETEAFPLGFSFVFVTNPQHILPLEEKLREMVGQRPDAEQVITAITTPRMALPFDAEHRAVDEVRKQWKALSPSGRGQALQALSRDFGWFGGIEGEREYGPEHYEAEVLSEPEKRPDIKPVSVDPDIAELGRLIAVLSNQRIWGRWYGMSVRYCTKLGVRELSNRLGIVDLEYATVPEIAVLVKTGSLDSSELVRRKTLGYVATLVGGEPVLLTGERARPFLEKVRETIENSDAVIGHCANPGKVTARVRIVSFASPDYHAQVAAFQKGEILVTGMTRPQIAHLLHKTAGIITDEGGITSHAAIVSREFNIPCLIGTHSATKIFKTGDLVELDAKNRVARRLHA